MHKKHMLPLKQDKKESMQFYLYKKSSKMLISL